MSLPSVELVPVDLRAAPVLARLMQLYAHDFSEFMDVPMSDEGLFATPDVERYIGVAGRHPFLLRAGDRLAGFAIVDEKSRFGNLDAPLDMAEFFVLRGYRRSGVGRSMAEALFSRFRGNWEVREIAKNVAATAFWRRVIGQYTSNAFQETLSDNDQWRGPVQRFDNRTLPAR